MYLPTTSSGALCTFLSLPAKSSPPMGWYQIQDGVLIYYSYTVGPERLYSQPICTLGVWVPLNIMMFIKIDIIMITAIFTNMLILKFKSQLLIAFFTAINHLNSPLRKQNFTLTGSKGHGLWIVIGGFRSILCVSVFQGSLLVIIIMIDDSEKCNCEGSFWTLELACLWKAQ